MTSAVVAVAMAAIGREMHLSGLQLQWVINAGLLPLAAITLVGGALGDRFGQRPVFLTGIGLVGAGLVIVGLAPSWRVLVGGRLIEGLGEALVLPNSLSILGKAFPANAKAKAVGIWSAVAAVASGIAPVVAGAILTHGGWRGVFLMLLPVVVAALVFGALWTPATPPGKRTPIDLPGAVLSTIGLAGLGAGLAALTSRSGFTSLVGVELGVGIVALGDLAIVEVRRGADAMLPLDFFTSRSVVGANLYTVLLYGPFTLAVTLIPYVMIRGTSLSTLAAGAAFIPLQILITVVSPLAGLLCRRFGRRPPLFMGAAVVACACASCLRIGPSAQYWTDIFPAVLLLAIGMSLAVAPLTTLVLTSVAENRAGAASGINSAVSRAGSLLAVALLGGVLQQSGARLFEGFHTAMIGSAAVCLLAVLSALIVERGPHQDFSPPADLA